MKKLLIYICLLFLCFGLTGCDLMKKQENPDDNPGQTEEPDNNPENPDDNPGGTEQPVKINFSDIKEIINGQTGVYKTRGTVVAISRQSFVIQDNTGMILVNREASWAPDIQIGSVVEVEGKTSIQRKAVLFNNDSTYFEIGINENIKVIEEELNETLSSNIVKQEKVEPRLVSLSGKLNVTGSYFNIELKDINEISVNLSYPIEANELQLLNEKELEIKGYIIGITGNKILNVILMDYEVIPTVEPENPDENPEQPGNEPDKPIQPPVSGSDTFLPTLPYYSSAKGKSGNELKIALRTIISNTKKTTTYAQLKTYLQEADEDPNNPDNMLLFYTGESVKKTDNMNIWNREHVWAQSLTNGWFGTSGAGADMHHLRPCNPGVNSSRGNKKFGTASGYYDPSKLGADYRGDVARIIFYMFTRYSQADQFTFTAIAQSKELLLEWNKLDPVSATEVIRNDYTYTIQGNRNPFIDHPEAADLIWGTVSLNNFDKTRYIIEFVIYINKKEDNLFI